MAKSPKPRSRGNLVHEAPRRITKSGLGERPKVTPATRARTPAENILASLPTSKPKRKKRSPNKAKKRAPSEPVQPVFVQDDPDIDPASGKVRPLPDTYARPLERYIPQAKLAAIDAMRRHGVIAEACRASGIGRSVLYELMKSDPDFRLRMQHARQERFDELERAMIERGGYFKGDLAGIFALKHNRKRYREVSRVELTGKEGGPVAYVDAKAELLRRLEQIAARSAPAQLAGSGGSRGPELVTDGEVEVRKITRGFSGKSRR